LFNNLIVKLIGINLVKSSSLSDDGHLIREGITARQPNEDLIVSATLPWYRKALESLTMYGELSVARTPEDFAPVCTRFQQEWSFAIGFVSRFATGLPDY
jgi:hypothetical protein